MRRNNQYYIRKTHRYLGVVIGIQFIFWTVSGLYFSWTNIDEIHGDHFHKESIKYEATNLIGISDIDSTLAINSLSLHYINNQPYYLIDDSLLYHAQTGKHKMGITEKEAIDIARNHIKDEYKIKSVELLHETGVHHEYRERPLPAFAIDFDGPSQLTAYVSQHDGKFQRVRHMSWRWFDFLWMTHTMDYRTRDDFNNMLLRAFSLFGLLTVASGFVLFFVTHKWKKKGR